MTRRSSRHRLAPWTALIVCLAAFPSRAAPAQAADIPELTQPVNDFAHVIDAANAAQMDTLIRALQNASGDVVVVATVPTIEPYGDIREYAVKMFENHGRGIGQKSKDNGVLVVLAVKERRVQVEVGYELEEFVTDGFAGETSREDMVPYFRKGDYGGGLRAGVTRIIERIASRRNVSLQGVPPPPAAREPGTAPAIGCSPILIIVIIILIWYVNSRGPRIGGGRRRRMWGGAPWSGWTGGVGGFGGGSFGGGFGGGGFGGGGGGFGGFGGGRSGGGGGGAGW